MSKTIQEVIDSRPAGVIAGIKLMLNHTITDNKILVIVEGDDDCKLYSRLFENEMVYIFPADGCGHYNQILEALNDKYATRFIMIKDADFDRMNGMTPEYDNLFITDGHDMETMISDGMFEEALQQEFLGSRQLAIIGKVKEDIRHISYIKWYNQKYECKINVERLKPFKQLYDGDTVISISCCLDVLCGDGRNKDVMVLSESDLLTFETNNATEDYDNLTNGHDLVEGISRRIWFLNSDQSKRKIKNPECVEIERMARMAFSVEKFMKTELYQSIKEWEIMNKCGILR